MAIQTAHLLGAWVTDGEPPDAHTLIPKWGDADTDGNNLNEAEQLLAEFGSDAKLADGL